MAQTEFVESQNTTTEDFKAESLPIYPVLNLSNLLSNPPTETFETIPVLKNTPFFADEILPYMSQDFSFGSPSYHNTNDYNTPIYFRGNKLRIQTPILQCMFGISKYKDPGNVTQKYSTHLTLRHQDVANILFKRLLNEIDDWVLSKVALPPETYYSAIRHNHANPNLPPVLRVKIPSEDDNLRLDIFTEEGEVNEPYIGDAETYIKHRQYMRCILELNGCWVAGNKFGVSYKLLQVQLINTEAGTLFR